MRRSLMGKYSLAGLTPEVCPECGFALAPAPVTPAPAPAPIEPPPVPTTPAQSISK